MISNGWPLSSSGTTSGTTSTVALCGQCGQWHALGYGCPNSTGGIAYAVSQGWACTDGHRFHAVDQQGHWLLFCRRCGDVRPLKETP